ncbi:hypothetical protein PFUGPA_02050 [Plasmodium falciparum Palo Alto/Uganda]|uniref:Uncharacterized protein n=1 Tax=Plasmodium falciparum (isolate Palo Alto / Uganda) TaxID=57270 RepID=W4J314_PLAFP|nr:hypothetical protein PFUGPA_02050 [Plasmodium falciparum Palo Alto/Uganda]
MLKRNIKSGFIYTSYCVIKEIIFYMRNILFIYFILINILYSNIKNNFFYINSLENKKYE